MIETEICGDRPLSAKLRLVYLWRNARRNCALSAWRSGVTARPLFADSLGSWNLQSPSRFLTDVFFERELPKIFPPNRATNVVEIGCGSGSLARRLAHAGFGGTYTGIDIGNRFGRDFGEKFPFDVTFIQGDVHDYTPAVPIDLLISVSALEHIADDNVVLARLATHMRPGGMEIHVVPSAAALYAYLWHGYRQYTPRALVERLGNGITLWKLGGAGTFAVHLTTITIPELLLGFPLRRRLPGLYGRLARIGAALDHVLPFAPTAYLVVRRH